MTNMADQPKDNIETLLAVMRALRDRESGCPWDIKQTYETIVPYTIEEAYEVADSIGRKDMAGLCDELGDLLLQVVYHAQMASEDGHFQFADVVAAINDKMIRRHPHVFGDEAQRADKPTKGFWERAKAMERTADSRVLDNVPTALPGLTRSVKLQAKAARVGFDWPTTRDVLDKVTEECSEVIEALETGDQAAATEEFGDLLFVLANLARKCSIDPEAAIRGANLKFERRFRHIEDRLAQSGRKPQDCDLSELDTLWDDAKAQEGKT
jgi:ATP diphosphatase